MVMWEFYSSIFNYMRPIIINQKEDRYSQFYMQCTYNAAELSYATRRKVGAVAVKDGNILGFGFNGTPAGCDNCCEDSNGETLDSVIHAEDNLLRKLVQLQGVPSIEHLNLDGFTFYVTKEPCINCAELFLKVKGQFELIFKENSKTKPLEGVHHLAKNAPDITIYRMPS